MADPATVPGSGGTIELEETCCGACGSGRRRPFLRKRGFTYCECVDCGHVFVSPRWTWPTTLERLYAPQGYHTASPGSGAGRDKTERARTSFEAREYLLRMRRVTGRVSGALFDVGCSVGGFLEEARAAGFRVSGCDVSPWAAAEARRSGLAVSTGDLRASRLPSESQDLVTMWEVLEHFFAPRDEMREAFRVLNSGGWLIFFTLNQSSRTAIRATHYLRQRGEDPFSWYRPEQHIQHFTPQSLRRMLGDAGFDRVVIELAASTSGIVRAMNRLGLGGSATELIKWFVRGHLAGPKRMATSLVGRARGGELLYGYAQKPR
jgi:2-polyprenyl-3-methyl-5-hydroxy-6-metoxy-1,4-benzoquinol methylase